MDERCGITRYVVTEGLDGPVVAGPYAGYELAIMARDGLYRPWRMIWRRRRYWVQPERES